jgi:hypothetical protein
MTVALLTLTRRTRPRRSCPASTALHRIRYNPLRRPRPGRPRCLSPRLETARSTVLHPATRSARRPSPKRAAPTFARARLRPASLPPFRQTPRGLASPASNPPGSFHRLSARTLTRRQTPRCFQTASTTPRPQNPALPGHPEGPPVHTGTSVCLVQPPSPSTRPRTKVRFQTPFSGDLATSAASARTAPPEGETARAARQPPPLHGLRTALPGHPKVSLPRCPLAASSVRAIARLPGPRKARSATLPHARQPPTAPPPRPPEGSRFAGPAVRCSGDRSPSPRSDPKVFPPRQACVRFVQPTCGSYFLRFQRTASTRALTTPLPLAGPPSGLCSA